MTDNQKTKLVIHYAKYKSRPAYSAADMAGVASTNNTCHMWYSARHKDLECQHRYLRTDARLVFRVLLTSTIWV